MSEHRSAAEERSSHELSDTTTDAAEYVGDEGASRQARLAGAVQGLRRRASGDMDRWLLIAGAVLIPLGAALILLGWHGVAHSPFQVQQTSYLVSGGILGLALVIAGGFLYFGYWLTRLVHEGRRHNEQLVAVIARLESRLPTASAEGNGHAPSAAVAAAGTLVATATGTMLHRPDCPVVATRDNVRQVAAGTPGYEPCKICDPLATTT